MDVTLPSFSAVASASIKFKIHEAKAEGSDPSDPLSSLSEAESKLLDSIQLDPENQLNPTQLERVRQLLAKRIKAFALDPKSPGHTHLMEVELPLLPGATAHRHPPSRVRDVGQGIIDKHVAEMESAGIIRKSTSAWASRVVLVSKKDGSVRFCVDYRDLNSKLRLSDSPLPLPAEAIDRLSSGNGSRDSLFLSTLDLASGFWAMPVKKRIRVKRLSAPTGKNMSLTTYPSGYSPDPHICAALWTRSFKAWRGRYVYLI